MGVQSIIFNDKKLYFRCTARKYSPSATMYNIQKPDPPAYGSVILEFGHFGLIVTCMYSNFQVIPTRVFFIAMISFHVVSCFNTLSPTKWGRRVKKLATHKGSDGARFLLCGLLFQPPIWTMVFKVPYMGKTIACHSQLLGRFGAAVGCF